MPQQLPQNRRYTRPWLEDAMHRALRNTTEQLNTQQLNQHLEFLAQMGEIATQESHARENMAIDRDMRKFNSDGTPKAEFEKMDAATQEQLAIQDREEDEALTLMANEHRERLTNRLPLGALVNDEANEDFLLDLERAWKAKFDGLIEEASVNGGAAFFRPRAPWQGGSGMKAVTDSVTVATDAGGGESPVAKIPTPGTDGSLHPAAQFVLLQCLGSTNSMVDDATLKKARAAAAADGRPSGGRQQKVKGAAPEMKLDCHAKALLHMLPNAASEKLPGLIRDAHGAAVAHRTATAATGAAQLTSRSTGRQTVQPRSSSAFPDVVSVPLSTLPRFNLKESESWKTRRDEMEEEGDSALTQEGEEQKPFERWPMNLLHTTGPDAAQEINIDDEDDDDVDELQVKRVRLETSAQLWHDEERPDVIATGADASFRGNVKKVSAIPLPSVDPAGGGIHERRGLTYVAMPDPVGFVESGESTTEFPVACVALPRDCGTGIMSLGNRGEVAVKQLLVDAGTL